MALVNRNKIAAIVAGGLLAALFAGAPARADDETAFGQPLPRQYLLNRLTNPKSAEPETIIGPSGQPIPNPQAAAEAKEAEDQGDGPYPRRYLLNRMFDMGK
jgi:hypothetical protein